MHIDNLLKRRILYLIIILPISGLLGFFIPNILQGGSKFLIILFIILGIFPIIILVLHPEIGLILLIPSGLLISFSIGTGTESSLNVTILLLAALIGIYLLKYFVQSHHNWTMPPMPVLAIGIFMIISVVCFGFGQIRWFPIDPAPIRAQLGGLAIFLLSGGAFWLSSFMIQNTRTIKWMVYPFLAIGFVYVLFMFFPALGSGITLFQNGATGSLFWVWLVSLSFGQALLNQDLKIFWRVCLLIISLTTIIYTVTPQAIGWSSGWLPALSSLISIILISKPKWRPFIVGFGLLFLLFEFQGIKDILFAGDNTYSLMTRDAAWQILGKIIQVDPAFGTGFANYYWYTPLFPILGFSVNFNSHNNYVDLISQTGIAGFLCLSWFVIEIWRFGFRLRNRVTNDLFQKAYVYSTLGGIIGMLVAGMLGDWVLPFVYNIGFTGFRSSILGWLFMGGLLAFDRINRTELVNEKPFNKGIEPG